MKIAERIHIVGSGQMGFHFTDDYDCHVYLLDGGDEYALVDAGGGRDVDGILACIAADGLDPRRVRRLLLTHAHADHAAGAAGLRERLASHSHDKHRPCISGERGARLPPRRRQPMTGFLLGLVFAAGVGIVWAGLTRSEDAAADFVLPACPVDEEVLDGMVVRVGDLALEVVDTPGHASGHVSYLLRHDGRVSVFCGDAFFFGGRILLQNTWDCSLQDSICTVERLAALSVDGLYPGHLTFAVRHGRRQVDKAMQAIANLLPPPQLG